MKKFLIAFLMIVAAAACTDDGKIQPNPTPNNTILPEFQQLTVNMSGMLPDDVREAMVAFEKKIVVTSKPEIMVAITEVVGLSGSPAIACSGTVPLIQDEYDSILELAKAANLSDYQPPSCDVSEELVGGYDITVTYLTTFGKENTFNTTHCELETELQAFSDGLQKIADSAIPECVKY